MTEHEHKLIENLTKQLELSNKIALKQMQEKNTPSINDERFNEAEIKLINEKERFYKNITDLIGLISIITAIIAIIGTIAAIISLGACASAF